MSRDATHLRSLWGAAALAVVSLLIGTVALASGAPSRRALLAQLERPAAVVRTPHAAKLVQKPRAYRLSVTLTPNRATVVNTVVARFTGTVAPLSGAQVTMTFSMPSMKMWRVLTLDAKAVGRGTYAATLPVLGMTGDWQIALRVTAGHHRPLTFAVMSKLTA
jgi:hypothetical protein